MKKIIILSIYFSLLLIACDGKKDTVTDNKQAETDSLRFKNGYADVNGIKMYYEIYGEGFPLVLIHGGGSTIQSSFGRIIPYLAKHRQLIAVELQAHGRTADRNADLSFEQNAADVVILLNNLNISKADIFGFSNGGQTAIEIGIHYPDIVNKLIIASAFHKRNAISPEFWEGFNHVLLKDMPQVLQKAQLDVNGNDTVALQNSFNKDVKRMKAFKGWTDEQLKSIKAPALIMSADKGASSPESTVEMYRLIPHSRLAFFPGIHGAYINVEESISSEDDKSTRPLATEVIERFLDEPYP